MKKIKLMTDSASDIPDEDLTRLGIDMLSIPITVDGIGFYERESFTFHEYYQILAAAKEIPVTSRISLESYQRCYEKNYALGYQHLINVTINAAGSGTYTSALMARDHFYEENPTARESFQIHILDSATYSLGYGWAVMEAAQRAQDDHSIESILAYLADWFAGVEVYLGCYTLKYAQKSGRIHFATAFVGELLGMRPLLLMEGGGSKTIAKVRGDRNVAIGLFQQYQARFTKEDTVLIVVGENPEPAKELQQMLKKERKIVSPIFQVGASVATNSGPHMLAIVCKSAQI